MAKLTLGNHWMVIVVLIIFCNNITLLSSLKIVMPNYESLPTEAPSKTYKSYRSVNLFDGSVPVTEDTSDDYFLLGNMASFKGPRRKKRELQLESGFKPMAYVFSEAYNHPSPKTVVELSRVMTVPPSINPFEKNDFDQPKLVATREAENNFSDSQPVSSGYENHYTQSAYPQMEQYKDSRLQEAMNNAWVAYGPKYNFRGDTPFPVQGRYTPPDYKNGFQEMESEWDQHVTQVPIPVRNRVILQPGIFNRFLSRYIDFEVNNHEIADFMRKLVFGFLIGILVVGWISLGLYIGFIPFKFLLFTGREKDTEGKLLERRSDLLTEITDRIFLALDSDWLKKLEERVKMDSDRKWIKTHVHCCILPQSQTKGMADCRVVRRERKLSPYKCLSDLLYSFQFGPSVDEPKDTDSNEARSTISNV